MPRTRSIKPEFWSDEKLASISILARLLYIGLWTVSDDYGCVKGHPIWLKSQIFPYDEKISSKQFIEALKELEELKRIIQYSANGEKYYYIPNFLKHQSIDRPSKINRNPKPPENIKNIFDEYSANNRRVLVDETETETETETIYCRDNPSASGEADHENASSFKERIPYREILDYLNNKTGKKYSYNTRIYRDLIRARWNEGKRFADFQKVVDIKFSQWAGDPKMANYLRPQTLFGTKMDSYLNENINFLEKDYEYVNPMSRRGDEDGSKN